MRALVIGGNCYVGKRFVRKLLENHHEVSVLNRGNLKQQDQSRLNYWRGNRWDLCQEGTDFSKQSWDCVIDFCCYNAEEAKLARDFFKHRAKHYVFISTVSVYFYGSKILESQFNPFEYSILEKVQGEEFYADAKRQAETIFSINNTMSLCSVRFPIILGEEDPTKRLSWHCKKLILDQEVYIPNLKAKMSFIHAQDAANCLYEIVSKKIEGPINLSSIEPIIMGDLFKKMEDIFSRKFIYADQKTRENTSPYGILRDWTLNVSRASRFKLPLRPISLWLDGLIKFEFSKLS